MFSRVSCYSLQAWAKVHQSLWKASYSIQCTAAPQGSWGHVHKYSSKPLRFSIKNPNLSKRIMPRAGWNWFKRCLKSFQQVQLWLVRDHWRNPQDCYHSGREMELGQEVWWKTPAAPPAALFFRKGVATERKKYEKREAWKKDPQKWKCHKLRPSPSPPSENQTIPFACK